RTHHRGTFPAPGWLPEYDWTGVVNPMDIPHGLAGPEGFFAHANNLLVEPSRNPVYFNTDSAPSYRVERILERIAAEKQHTMDTSASIQVDLELKRARRVLPFMLEDLGARDDWNGAESAALALLKGWDCVAQADSAATAIFFATYREAATAALRDEVDANGFEFILAQRYSSNAYDLWFENVQQPVWDDLSTGGVTETRTGAVQAAFKRAVAWMISRQGPSPSAWRWGEMHDIQFTHVFGKQKLLAGFFNLPRAELGGGCDSVWKTHFDLGDPEAPFKVTAGPVFRMVLDLADIEHGRWVLDTGNSGWPGSPHYGDQFPLWRDGQYLPMCSNWGEIEKDVSAVLTLQ
ncbi:MAG: penicillin amidase, partial [Candidatus Hydrogenedentes bacterium]|nr:penicillin amidase [Candidatus Hydrogenedentota bacterium]